MKRWKVLDGRGQLVLGDCLEYMRNRKTDSVDMIIGSPPYCDARTYVDETHDYEICRNAQEWVTWMLDVSQEAVRICRGPVFWVCAGVTRDWTYWPACEGLAWEWFQRGGSSFRPVYWHRVGIPGSGGEQGFRSDIEYVLWFKKPGKLPYANPLASAKRPRYGKGGGVSNRNRDGKRDNRSKQPAPKLANPGNLLSIKVGGGKMGSRIAHENEAPYPADLPKYFIRCYTERDNIVLDPFGGSGTTAAASIELGRRFVSCDIRMSQIELMRKRIRQSDRRKGFMI